MTFQEYQIIFESILKSANPPAPYDVPDYFNYAKLNWSRMSRWTKVAVPSEQIVQTMQGIVQPQLWIVITEPWCGDAAHIIPFINMIASLNPLVKIDYQLRDAAPHLIGNYLTNGGKSIPKLIIRDHDGHDLSSWGPRPLKSQALYNQLKAKDADFETIKSELQKWYNADKGIEIQQELNRLISLNVSL
jgi:hypothetical protein